MAITNTTPDEHHFFASSCETWRTNTDITQLIKDMKKDKLGFNLFYVPLPDKTPYEINFYQPQVAGVIWLNFVK